MVKELVTTVTSRWLASARATLAVVVPPLSATTCRSGGKAFDHRAGDRAFGLREPGVAKRDRELPFAVESGCPAVGAHDQALVARSDEITARGRG